MITVTVTTAFTACYLLLTLWLCRRLRWNTRAVAVGGLTCALTLVLASIRIPLPTGAAITCGSWIPLMLLALVYDSRLAMVSGWLCGVLSLFLLSGWQPVHWAQIFVEHLICFSCLGYAGIFGSKKRWKMLLGMVVAVVLRFWAHVFSGVIFFSQNAWDGWGAWGYSLAYHLSSKLPEGIATICILLFLPVGFLRNTVRKDVAP